MARKKNARVSANTCNTWKKIGSVGRKSFYFYLFIYFHLFYLFIYFILFYFFFFFV